MSFTLAGVGITRAIVRKPRFGIWTATAAVAGPLDLADGARVSLVLGDLTLTGTAHPGGTFGGQAQYHVTGGAGAWGATVAERAHRSDGGITVAEVAADLVTDAGEIGVTLEPGAERPLGYAWVRRAGVASDALTALVGSAWWVADDGVTHLGPRPATAIAPPTLRGLDYEPALRRATVALSDDAIAQFQPGAVLSHPSLPAPLEIGDVTIRIEADAVEIDLLGERPPSELLGAMLAAREARARLLAPQVYQVTEDAQGRTSGRAAGPAAAALPDVAWLDRAYGLPGARADLAVGSLVLVALLDGSPGAPRVVGYLPGAAAPIDGPHVPNTLPVTVGLDAQTSIELGESGSCSALAIASEVMANLNALRSAIVLLGGSPPAMTSVSTLKVKGE